ncbi:auracyanin, partial [Candidatus Gracilibacteria bacterium]|nr:auracyanin [Candidatus Gracilibacteria bacterium]
AVASATAAVAPQATATPVAQATVAPTAGADGGAAAGGVNEAGGSAIADGTPEEELTLAAAADALAFAETELSAPANTVVRLTFENQNDLGVQHNWVLVDGGDDVAASVNEAAQDNSAALFVPPTGTDGALAYTAMLNVGQSGEVVFTTPDAGTYTYICTFPGHYLGGMVGVLTVE